MSSDLMPSRSPQSVHGQALPLARRYLKLRVFVASPQDVFAERQILHRRVEVLNRMGNAADELGVVLEVLDWHTQVSPFMGPPQKVINEQIPVETWDIFIGILWMRFGIPTGAADVK